MTTFTKLIADQTLTDGSLTDGALEPHIVADPNGGFHISLSDEFGGGDFDTRRFSFDENGVQQTIIPLSSTSSNLASRQASITYLSDGRYVAVWTDEPTGSVDDVRVVKAEVFNADGTIDVAEFFVEDEDFPGSQSMPVVAASTDGGFAIAYYDTFPSIRAVVKVYDEAGTSVIETLSPINFTAGVFNFGSSSTSFDPMDLVALDDGTYFLAWTGDDNFSRAQRFDSDGNRIGLEIDLNGGTQSGIFPRITVLEDGRILVTTTVNGVSSGEIFNTDGTISVATFEIATSVRSGFEGNFADVSALPDGRIVVVWVDSVGEIKGQILNADGTKNGAVFDIATVSDGDQARPTITVLESGQFAVAWETTENDRDDIKFTIFGTPETPSLNVTTTEDVVDALDGETSLREAIAFAATVDGADTITFDESLSGGQITLNGTELVLTSDVTINGDIDGDDVADITINGAGTSRVFNVAEDTTSTLAALTIRNGYVGNFGNGGGILNSGNLSVTNSTLSGNRAALFGGGIDNTGDLTVTNSTLSGNRATLFGGGIDNDGTLTVTNSTLSGNNADFGGGINNDGTLTVTNSIVLGNTAADSGADIEGAIDTRTASIIGDADGITAADVFADVANGGGVLADNGGGVQTIALRASLDNPALDIGDVVPGLTTDATGNDRSFDVVGVNNGGTVDAGAVELPGTPETSSLIVTTTTDVVDVFDGETSLREAIALANNDGADSTITFDASLDGETLRLTQGELKITQALTINGGGVITISGDADGDDTKVDGLTDVAASGSAGQLSDNSRLFALLGSNADTTFAGLTLTGGSASEGGAIAASNAGIMVSDSTIGGNTASNVGGGIFNQDGTTTVTNSTLSGNSADDNGGGIFNGGGGTLSVIGSTLSENNAENDGGGISNDGTLTVTNSTLNGNFADAGGGITNDGTLTVTNSTLSGNFADFGGGFLNFDGTATVTNSTISGNAAENGGGIYTFGDDASTRLSNSIVAGNYAAGRGNDTSGLLTVMGGNIVSETFSFDGVGGATGIAIEEIFAQTAEVVFLGESTGVFAGVLGDNGGDVQTIALLVDAANPALDASNADAPATDGIGIERVDIPGVANSGTNIADLGALEVGDAEQSSLIVNTDADILNPFDGVTSLREAIAFAATEAGANTITFDDALDGGTITLAGTELVLTSDVTINGDIDGDGAADITIDGAGTSRVFNVAEDTTSTLTALTIQNGNLANSGFGGGIRNSGDLTVTNSTLIGNTARLAGGGIFNDLAATLTVTNSTLSANSAGFDGGGIFNGFDTTLTVTNSTLSGNTARDGGGIVNGSDATLTVTNSIVLGNTAENSGADIDGSVTTRTASIIGDVDGITAADVFADVANGAGVLADNGGGVQTIALLADADNPALDNAMDAVATDARGRDRSDFAGLGLGIADIGAFELINDAPVFTSAAAVSVAEGDVAVTTVAAEDDVDTGLAFSIGTGLDGALFNVNASTGAVTFKDAPNFEAPDDANGDNVYQVSILANDGTNETSQTLNISVTDVDEAETIIATPDGGTITGSDEGDTIAGNTGDDVVNAGLGDDVIIDAGGNDTIDAGAGDDRVGLLSGTNTVDGGEGNDLIVGGFNSDVLVGGTGNDVIRGDASTRLFGIDEITGGAGNDLLEGGGGVDTFVFKTDDGDDTIGTLSIDYDDPSNTTVTGADFVSGVDLVQLDGFGLADGAAALAAVSDVGGVATFNAEGTSITFTGLTADDLSADDFILV